MQPKWGKEKIRNMNLKEEGTNGREEDCIFVVGREAVKRICPGPTLTKEVSSSPSDELSSHVKAGPGQVLT